MILKFKRKYVPDPEDVFAEDGLHGTLDGQPENSDVDLYVRTMESGAYSFLYTQTHNDKTAYTCVEMTSQQAAALGRALLGKSA